MNQKMKSRLLLVIAAVGLALTVKMYPKPQQNEEPKASPQAVESVMETVSESETDQIVESTEAK